MYVQFRKDKEGIIIAVFPYQIENIDTVMGYSHVGQHWPIAWNIHTVTTAANTDEYAALLYELRQIGYNNLKVVILRNHTKYLHALKCFTEMRQGHIIIYHRKPTKREIKFGEGVIHYRDFARSYVTKADGTLKQWFIDEYDGLRYNY